LHVKHHLNAVKHDHQKVFWIASKLGPTEITNVETVLSHARDSALLFPGLVVLYENEQDAINSFQKKDKGEMYVFKILNAHYLEVNGKFLTYRYIGTANAKLL